MSDKHAPALIESVARAICGMTTGETVSKPGKRCAVAALDAVVAAGWGPRLTAKEYSVIEDAAYLLRGTEVSDELSAMLKQEGGQ